MGFRVALLRVNKAREQHWVSNEEDWRAEIDKFLENLDLNVFILELGIQSYVTSVTGQQSRSQICEATGEIFSKLLQMPGCLGISNDFIAQTHSPCNPQIQF